MKLVERSGASRLASLAVLVAFALAGCLNSQRNESVSLSNEGAKFYGQKAWDTAIERFTKATERWSDNHQAWYGLAAAYAQQKKWDKAADAAEKATQIEPDIAMYHLYLGWYAYEKAKFEAKDFQAKKEGKRLEEVEVDLTGVNFERAMTHLQKAGQLNGDLWRAFFLMGEINKHMGKTKEAAEMYTRSLELGAFDPAPWIALAELYLAWDYSDEAIKVAEQGLLVVPGAHEKSDIWYEVGMGYDSKRMDDKAIEAFNKALEARSDNHLAKFQRGQAYYRKKDWPNAKRDLEEFSKSGSNKLEFFKQQSSRMLMDIASKTAGGTGVTGAKPSPEDLVKQAQ